MYIINFVLQSLTFFNIKTFSTILRRVVCLPICESSYHKSKVTEIIGFTIEEMHKPNFVLNILTSFNLKNEISTAIRRVVDLPL